MRTTSTRVALAATASVLVLGLAACGDSDDGHAGGSMAGGSSARSSASAPTDHDQADVMFSMMMVPHHLQAVEMADLVPSRSTDAEVIALAGRIKAAQQPEVDTMASWLGAWGAEPVLGHDDMDHAGTGGMMSADDLRELAALTGPDFDDRWLEMMVEHHEGAVEMAQDVIRSGRHAPTRALAVDIVEAQQREIAQMKAMLAR